MTKLSEWFYSGRYIDEALRYMPIVDIIRSESIDRSTVLDVGSGSKGFAKFVKLLKMGYPFYGSERYEHKSLKVRSFY